MMYPKPVDGLAVVDVNIRCNRQAFARLRRLAEEAGGVAARAWGFRCNSCGQGWGRQHVSTADDLEHTSCSNCYGDEVTIIRAEVKFADPVAS
jgi:hypothetical protein